MKIIPEPEVSWSGKSPKHASFELFDVTFVHNACSVDAELIGVVRVRYKHTALGMSDLDIWLDGADFEESHNALRTDHDVLTMLFTADHTAAVTFTLAVITRHYRHGVADGRHELKCELKQLIGV